MDKNCRDEISSRLFGTGGGLVQFRVRLLVERDFWCYATLCSYMNVVPDMECVQIFSFLDAQSMGRCGSLSKHLANLAREDENWKVVLQREFDAAPPRCGSCREIVKNLYESAFRM